MLRGVCKRPSISSLPLATAFTSHASGTASEVVLLLCLQAPLTHLSDLHRDDHEIADSTWQHGSEDFKGSKEEWGVQKLQALKVGVF